MPGLRCREQSLRCAAAFDRRGAPAPALPRRQTRRRRLPPTVNAAAAGTTPAAARQDAAAADADAAAAAAARFPSPRSAPQTCLRPGRGAFPLRARSCTRHDCAMPPCLQALHRPRLRPRYHRLPQPAPPPPPDAAGPLASSAPTFLCVEAPARVKPLPLHRSRSSCFRPSSLLLQSLTPLRSRRSPCFRPRLRARAGCSPAARRAALTPSSALRLRARSALRTAPLTRRDSRYGRRGLERLTKPSRNRKGWGRSGSHDAPAKRPASAGSPSRAAIRDESVRSLVCLPAQNVSLPSGSLAAPRSLSAEAVGVVAGASCLPSGAVGGEGACQGRRKLLDELGEAAAAVGASVLPEAGSGGRR